MDYHKDMSIYRLEELRQELGDEEYFERLEAEENEREQMDG